MLLLMHVAQWRRNRTCGKLLHAALHNKSIHILVHSSVCSAMWSCMVGFDAIAVLPQRPYVPRCRSCAMPAADNVSRDLPTGSCIVLETPSACCLGGLGQSPLPSALCPPLSKRQPRSSLQDRARAACGPSVRWMRQFPAARRSPEARDDSPVPPFWPPLAPRRRPAPRRPATPPPAPVPVRSSRVARGDTGRAGTPAAAGGAPGPGGMP